MAQPGAGTGLGPKALILIKPGPNSSLTPKEERLECGPKVSITRKEQYQNQARTIWITETALNPNKK